MGCEVTPCFPAGSPRNAQQYLSILSETSAPTSHGTKRCRGTSCRPTFGTALLCSKVPEGSDHHRWVKGKENESNEAKRRAASLRACNRGSPRQVKVDPTALGIRSHGGMGWRGDGVWSGDRSWELAPAGASCSHYSPSLPPCHIPGAGISRSIFPPSSALSVGD